MADNENTGTEPNEPQTAPPATEPTAGTDPQPQPEPKPWEKDGQPFDPERAWNLVQHLREENKGLKEKNRAYEDEKLTEKEKADRDLTETRAQIEQLRTEKTLAEIRAKYPALTADDMEFLGTGSPEELEQKAAKLAARLQPAGTGTEPKPNINPLRRQPTGGTDPTGNDQPHDFIREALAGMQR